MKSTREYAMNNGQTGKNYLLHEFVLMPDHFHLPITPAVALEGAVQLLKGGFSYRAKKEFVSNAEIWQRGFSDPRLRDAEDYDRHVHCIHLNPVKKHLCGAPAAYPGWKLDPMPQGLKPGSEATIGAAEALPLQNIPQGLKPGVVGDGAYGTAEAAPLQDIGYSDSFGTRK